MSLRTKILAAVVGLNLLVLLLGISVLVFVLPPTAGVPADLLSLATAVTSNPGSGADARKARVNAVDSLRAGAPGVLALWLEEAEDKRRNWYPADRGPAEPQEVSEDVRHADALLREARRQG